MSLITTPAGLQQKSEFYHQLGSLLSAGISLPQGLELCRKQASALEVRQTANIIHQKLMSGHTFGEAIQPVPWFPEFDKHLLSAGEKSGRLEVCFKLLADYYRDSASMGKQVIQDLSYPIFIIHFAVLVFPPSAITQLLDNGGPGKFLISKLALLLPLYAVVIGLLISFKSTHGASWRAAIESFLRCVPLVGTARKHQALARLALSLEALLNAGVGVIESWTLAAKASGSVALERAVARWKPNLEGGRTPSEEVNHCDQFPEAFAMSYHAGEISGKLDENLRRLHQHYQESAQMKMKSISQWTPKILALVIFIIIGHQIVSFWQDYYSNVGKMLGE